MNEHVTPGMIAGAVQPDGTRIVSPEAQDVLDRLKAHYQSMGKAAAASNYNRHLRSLFAWAENHGHSIRTLPSDAVETFLGDLRNAGQKEATIHVMRTQIKSALREAHNALGVDFAHLEYQTGKPREVRRAQKEREKAKRQEKRLALTIAQAQAIMTAQQSGTPLPRPDMPVPDFNFAPPAPVIDLPPVPPALTPEELPMSTASAPASEGTMANGAAAPQQQPVVVVQMPPQNQRPTTTIGAAKPAGQQTTTVGRGMTINSHTFSGPYIRISRMADGTDPLTPPGTETYITTVPLTQLQPHGDAAAYLQSFILPNLRIPPSVGQVHFVFHELNDRRQPTGRRDELVVSVPMGMAPQASGPQQPSFGGTSLNGLPTMGLQNDSATNYLLRKLDDDAASAKRRADELQEKLRTEKDSQTMFLLMQQFQKEQDLRRELEAQKQQAMMQMQQMMAPPPAPLPMPMIDPPKPDASAEMVRAMAENQAKMMEAMMVGMRPQPPPPQKDAAEWLLPFLGQMNQQAQAQQQANQQMLVGIMQSNQQFMQALLTRENPVEKMLLAQLQEVKAEARAPKGDEMEDFAEKLQKMKMVSDMLGGGGGGASSVLGELLSNAEAIGEGAAKIIAASKARVTLPDQPTGAQLAGAPTPQALPAQSPQAPQTVGPPPAVLEAIAKLEEAAKKEDDQGVVTEVVNVIRHLIDAGMPAAGMGNRLLTAFKDMDDEAEMFTFAKSMWLVAGKKADKKLAKVVAAILTKWYVDIHEQLFGKRRAIGEDVIDLAEPEGDDDDDADDEDAEDSDDDGDSEVEVTA